MELAPLKKPPQRLADVERKYILRVLFHFNWNRSRAAKALDVSLRTIRNKIRLWRQQGHVIPDGTRGPKARAIH
jgi:two-component system, response regulator FlrC